MTDEIQQFNVDKINRCMADIEGDLTGVAKGNISACRRVRGCLMELSKECAQNRKALMAIMKTKMETNKASKVEKALAKVAKVVKPAKPANKKPTKK
jgi:hypothetical protein